MPTGGPHHHPPPRLTCTSWAILDGDTGELLLHCDAFTPVQIASLTKIMTSRLVLRLADREPGLLSELVLISPEAASMRGTTAELRAGEVYTVRDLLFATMLPSGNDAAFALAEYVGDSFSLPDAGERILTSRAAQGTAAALALTKTARHPLSAFPSDHPHHRFIAEMNREAIRLGLRVTRFGNVHGLADARQQSCAADAAVLAWAALRQSPVLRELGRTPAYACTARRVEGSGGGASGAGLRTSSGSASALGSGRESALLQVRRPYPCVVTWRNSNELLGGTLRVIVGAAPPATPPPGTVATPSAAATAGAAPASLAYRYEGLKTGITTTAGGCLASHLTLVDAQPLVGSAGARGGSGSSSGSSSSSSGSVVSGASSAASASTGGASYASCVSSSPAGVTPAAPPPYRRSLIVVVLGSSGKSTRFADTHALAAWAVGALHAAASASPAQAATSGGGRA